MNDIVIPGADVTRTSLYGGEQVRVRFPNGYGASAVRHEFSYGGRDGKWELAVLDRQGHLTYDTPITSNVIGWLDDDEVIDLLRKISELEVAP